MVLVKILGGIDFAAAIAFLMLIFGIKVFTPYILFCAALLALKGMFVFTGDILSIVDIFSALILVISIFITPFAILLWVPAFLLLAKGIVSFM